MNLLHALKDKYLIMTDDFFYSGPLLKEFLSAFWKSLPRQIVKASTVAYTFQFEPTTVRLLAENQMKRTPYFEWHFHLILSVFKLVEQDVQKPI